jgi:hypothetical protein
MRISELLEEQKLTPAQQIAKDAELIAQHQRQQWLKQQQTTPPTAAPAAPTAPEPTLDQIAKHPQYNAVYQKILKQIQAQSTFPNPKIDAERAKKFTDQRIARMIQSGQLK